MTIEHVVNHLKRKLKAKFPKGIVKYDGDKRLFHVTIPRDYKRGVAVVDLSDSFVVRFDGMDEKYIYLFIDLNLAVRGLYERLSII